MGKSWSKISFSYLTDYVKLCERMYEFFCHFPCNKEKYKVGGRQLSVVPCMLDFIYAMIPNMPHCVVYFFVNPLWWCRMSTTLSLILLVTWLFVQQLQANNKEDTKATYYWPFMRRIHWWLVVSHHKGPVMRKIFSCPDVFISNLQFVYPFTEVVCERISGYPWMSLSVYPSMIIIFLPIHFLITGQSRFQKSNFW